MKPAACRQHFESPCRRARLLSFPLQAMRTLAENSSLSDMVHSAPVAPSSIARFTALDLPGSIIPLSGCTHVPFPPTSSCRCDRGNPHANRYALPFLAADADALVGAPDRDHHATYFKASGPLR